MQYNFGSINLQSPHAWDRSNERNAANSYYNNAMSIAGNKVNIGKTWADGVNAAGQSIAQGIRDYRNANAAEEQRLMEFDQLMRKQKMDDWRFQQEQNKAAEEAAAKKSFDENLNNFTSQQESAVNAAKTNRRSDLEKRLLALEESLGSSNPQSDNTGFGDLHDVEAEKADIEAQLQENEQFDMAKDPRYQLAVASARNTGSIEPLSAYFNKLQEEGRYNEERSYRRERDSKADDFQSQQLELQRQQLEQNKAEENKLKEIESQGKKWSTRLGELDPSFIKASGSPADFNAFKANKAQLQSNANEVKAIYDWANANGDSKNMEKALSMLGMYYILMNPKKGPAL